MYTDVSLVFFEHVRERWPDLASQGSLTEEARGGGLYRAYPTDPPGL